MPVRNNLRRQLDLLRTETLHEPEEERTLLAAVTARQDRDLAPLFAEGPRKHFDDRRLAGAAAGEVADADHQTAERMVPDHPLVVHPDPELYRHAVEARGDEQNIDQNPVVPLLAAPVHELEEVLFEVLPLEFESRMHVNSRKRLQPIN